MIRGEIYLIGRVSRAAPDTIQYNHIYILVVGGPEGLADRQGGGDCVCVGGGKPDRISQYRSNETRLPDPQDRPMGHAMPCPASQTFAGNRTEEG